MNNWIRIQQFKELNDIQLQFHMINTLYLQYSNSNEVLHHWPAFWLSWHVEFSCQAQFLHSDPSCDWHTSPYIYSANIMIETCIIQYLQYFLTKYVVGNTNVCRYIFYIIVDLFSRCHCHHMILFLIMIIRHEALWVLHSNISLKYRKCSHSLGSHINAILTSLVYWAILDTFLNCGVSQ